MSGVTKYVFKDNRGRVTKIRAASMSQARLAMAQINETNDKQPDGGRALSASWRRSIPALY